MEISYMPNMEDVYQLLVVTREYPSGRAEAPPITQGTSEEVADFVYEVVVSQFGNRESAVIDGRAENENWTDLLLKRCNIHTITISQDHVTTNGVIERGHRPNADGLSNLTACSNEQKELRIDHLQAGLWANRIAVRHTTG